MHTNMHSEAPSRPPTTSIYTKQTTCTKSPVMQNKISTHLPLSNLIALTIFDTFTTFPRHTNQDSQRIRARNLSIHFQYTSQTHVIPAIHPYSRQISEFFTCISRIQQKSRPGGRLVGLTESWQRDQRSVQEMQGSMLLTMSGISATWQPAIITWRASQFM